jgi:uncharacterized peroxidase-related enzyme
MEHHGAGLRGLLRARGIESGEAEAIVAGMARDHLDVGLDPADRVMLEYALKLTRTPGEIERADIERLRAAGFDDRAIHDVCSIAAYYAFVNRIADGLGVELEPKSFS